MRACCNNYFGSDLAARALCPHSWLLLVLPHAVCRGSGTSHNLNDHDHDEMKVHF
jgi:hypothetical protein